MLLIKNNGFFEIHCCEQLLAAWVEKYGLICIHEVFPCPVCKSKTVETTDPEILKMLGKEKKTQ